MISDTQELFLIIYSITYVLTLDNWPPDSFATAAMLAGTEYVEEDDGGYWKKVTSSLGLTKARRRYFLALIFGTALPLVYLGYAISLMGLAPPLLGPFSWYDTVIRVVLVGLCSLPPHGFARVFFGLLLKFETSLADKTTRYKEYMKERESRAYVYPRHHLGGSLFYFFLAFSALMVLTQQWAYLLTITALAIFLVLAISSWSRLGEFTIFLGFWFMLIGTFSLAVGSAEGQLPSLILGFSAPNIGSLTFIFGALLNSQHKRRSS